ncbi:MAG: DUF58 domain-containing protein [Euryarchaeota archaeon]|nr:DUF58 domain-containing protein [Euryarchaeota archaeon]
MISRSAHVYFKAFTLLFILGFVFGNLNFAVLAVFFLGFFLLGLNVGDTKDIAVERTYSRTTPRVGEEVDVTVRVKVGRGIGFVETYDALPEIFELTQGSNVHLLWKALGRRSETAFTYRIKCTKRGSYDMRATQVTRINPLRLKRAVPETFSEPDTLIVRHKPTALRRMKEVRGFAQSQRVDADLARVGSQSTDFEEIREYQRGDPIKNINWKATARMSTRGTLKPMVNKFEPEGKKAVWFFLDAANYMQAGSSIENTFEYVVKATTGVAKFFIDKGFKIGGTFFNARKDVQLYPDLGERQYFRVAQELAALEAGAPRPGAFSEAVEGTKNQLIPMRPVSIVITRPEVNFEQTIEGLRVLRKYTAMSRRIRPIIVINPLVYSSVAGSDDFANWSMLVLKAENRSRYHLLRRMGVTVIDWDPKKEDISVRLLRQVRTR